MIELRENGIAIVHRGLGYHGDKTAQLIIRNWGTKWSPTIEIHNDDTCCSMKFKADELIALAEIFKQLKTQRK